MEAGTAGSKLTNTELKEIAENYWKFLCSIYTERNSQFNPAHPASDKQRATGREKGHPAQSGYQQAEASSNPASDKQRYPDEYLDEVLVCRRLKAAIRKGVTDPIKLAEKCGLPVCLVAKFPGVNSMAAANLEICSKCGRDLTGRSSQTLNNKLLCYNSGCDVPPARRDAEESEAEA